MISQKEQHIKQFEDIPLFNQYDGKFPVLNPKYDNTAYLTAFQKLKTLIKTQQHSTRSNKLANFIAHELPSNYSAWQMKRRCFQAGSSNIQDELLFTENLLVNEIKNFQGWEFRRFLIERRGDPKGEIEFIERVLLQDHKNYHLWTYRVWLCRQFKLYEEEKANIGKWIALDVMNNTAWTYRFFLNTSTTMSQEEFAKELEYIIEKIKLSHDNEATWAYLRGWFPSIKLKNIPCQSQHPVKSYKDYPQIQQMCIGLAEFNKKLIQPYVTLVHIYSQQDPLQAKGVKYGVKQICELLAQKDEQKHNYWRWVQANL